MDIRLIARAAGLGIAALIALAATIFAWVLIYAYVVAPGHAPAFYQDYAARVAPLAGIVLGLPVFAFVGHLAVRGRDYSPLLTIVPAAAFILVDLALLGLFQPSAFAAWPLLILSWLSKLFAAWAGARFGSRSVSTLPLERATGPVAPDEL